MKDQVARTLVCLVLGALACHVKILGCYPLVAIIFGAFYLEEENRRVCVPFFYLWMVLFLPIASLFRYGIVFLVWMVVLSIFWHMHVALRHFGQAVMLGMILVAVSYGGQVMTAAQRMRVPWIFIPPLEGMLVAGGTYVVAWALGICEALIAKTSKKKRKYAMSQISSPYSRAMSGLAKSMEALVCPQESKTDVGIVMQQELKERICGRCGHYDICFATGSEMAVTMESLFTQAQNGQVIDPALEEKIEKQCERAELLIREALGIFERTELNLSWYRRLCEHREMIAGQMDAMAYFMEDAMEQDELCDEKERLHIAKIRFQLREVGLRVWELHFYRRKNGTCRIVMELAARPGICTTSKEVLAMLESCVSEPLVMAEENRNIVGRDRARYVFVTRPKIAWIGFFRQHCLMVVL